MRDDIWDLTEEIMNLNEEIKRENEYWDRTIRLGIRKIIRTIKLKKL